MQLPTFLRSFTAGKDTRSVIAFGLLVLVCILSNTAAIVTNEMLLTALPIGLLFILVAVYDISKIYFLLLFCLPFSTELDVPGGVQIYFPAEILMVTLMFIIGIYILGNPRKVNASFFKHPISILLLVQLLWIGVCTLNSTQPIYSLKYLLSKFWYITPFYLGTLFSITSQKDIKTLLWVLIVPLSLCILYVTIDHYILGFGLSTINSAVSPIFRNKVNYGSINVILLPLVFVIRSWYPRLSLGRIALGAVMILLLLAVYLSFTRAAYACIGIAIGSYFILRFKLTKLAVLFALIGGIVFALYLTHNDRYLEYAPDYNKTVTHQNFDNLLSATAKGEDISTMERVYRWVAAYQIFREHPLLGIGPSSFYEQYKKYTVSSFTTYVSDNEEKSGVHSYYIMLLVEQGIIGLVLFLILCFYAIIRAEELYHNTEMPRYKKQLLCVAYLTLICIFALNLVNDMIETLKVGGIFFICLAFIVFVDVSSQIETKKR